VTELMKRIPIAPPRTTSKPNKLATMVDWCNLEVCNEKCDSIELEELIRLMKKTFVTVEVLEQK